jgi:hypothetical protein
VGDKEEIQYTIQSILLLELNKENQKPQVKDSGENTIILPNPLHEQK